MQQIETDYIFPLHDNIMRFSIKGQKSHNIKDDLLYVHGYCNSLREHTVLIKPVVFKMRERFDGIMVSVEYEKYITFKEKPVKNDVLTEVI